MARRTLRVVRRFHRPGRSDPRRRPLPRRHPTRGDSGRARLPGRPARLQGRDPGRRVSRKLQALLFVCGSAVFAYLVARIAVGTLLAAAVHTGWMFVPILMLYGWVYALFRWAAILDRSL